MIAARRSTLLPTVSALLLACASCDAPVEPELADTLAFSRNPNRVISRSFNARLFTRSAGLAPDPACGEAPRFLETQSGEGWGTYIGRFRIHFTFCVDITDLMDDGQLTDGESVPYDNVLGVLVTANGDELHIGGSGQVLPTDHPEFDFEFHDSFTITGGTGRFEGASGEIVTDSRVSQSRNRTNHRWAGTLTVERRR